MLGEIGNRNRVTIKIYLFTFSMCNVILGFQRGVFIKMFFQFTLDLLKMEMYYIYQLLKLYIIYD